MYIKFTWVKALTLCGLNWEPHDCQMKAFFFYLIFILVLLILFLYLFYEGQLFK